MLLVAMLAPAYGGFLQIDLDAEKRLGTEIDKWMRGQFKMAGNPMQLARLNMIGHRLADAADRDGKYSWHFKVYRGDGMNAVATCAGHVYACAGLFSLNDDEMAGVLAHELAHIMKNHVAKSYMAEYQAFVFDEAVVDRAVEDLRMYHNGPAGPHGIFNMGRNTMARNFEREADVTGVHYAADAGFDPMGHVSALKKMYAGRSTKSPKGIKAKLNMSHPELKERIDRITREARKVQGVGG